jgi:hypothetical protein
MKERPILFSAPMVRALLEGRKTQTRRIVKPKPSHVDAGGRTGAVIGKFAGHVECLCPYGMPGELLWVRETFAKIPGQTRDWIETDYRATYTHGDRLGDSLGIKKKWTPSIHMPRAASRITLRITDVRVERLQSISEDDAIAEGIDGPAVRSVHNESTVAIHAVAGCRTCVFWFVGIAQRRRIVGKESLGVGHPIRAGYCMNVQPAEHWQIVLRRLTVALLSYRYRFASEKQLHDGIAAALDVHSIKYEREHIANKRDRFDFLCAESIVIEAKIQGSLPEAMSQVNRYCELENVQAAIIATSKKWTRGAPASYELNGKPVRILILEAQSF